MKMEAREKTLCRTPTPGKEPTRIDAWKFDAVRRAILEVLASKQNCVPFRDLPGLVALRLSEQELGRLGSVAWYTTTVKLELEVRGEIRRVKAATPQCLRLADGSPPSY